MEKRSAKTSLKTRTQCNAPLSLPLPARTSAHRRRAWGLRKGGAGDAYILMA